MKFNKDLKKRLIEKGFDVRLVKYLIDVFKDINILKFSTLTSDELGIFVDQAILQGNENSPHSLAMGSVDKIKIIKLLQHFQFENNQLDHIKNNFKISGLIVDKVNKTPMHSYNIKIFSSNKQLDNRYLGDAVSDNQGKFVIKYRKDNFVNNVLVLVKKGKVRIILKIYNHNDKVVLTTDNIVFDGHLESNVFELEYDAEYNQNLILSDKVYQKQELKDPYLFISKDKRKYIDSILNDLEKIVVKHKENTKKSLSGSINLISRALKTNEYELSLHLLSEILHDMHLGLKKSERRKLTKMQDMIKNMRNYNSENYYQYRFSIDTEHEKILLDRVKDDSWRKLIQSRILLTEGYQSVISENFVLAIEYFNRAKNLLGGIHEIANFREHTLLVYRSNNVIGSLVKRRLEANLNSLCGELESYAWHAIFFREPPQGDLVLPFVCTLPVYTINWETEVISRENENIISNPLEYGMLNIQQNYRYTVLLNEFIIDLAIAEAYIGMNKFNQGITLLLTIIDNEYINIPIEQNYIRCQLMQAYLQKANLHYRRGELEEARHAYEAILLVYKKTGKEIAHDDFGVDIDSWDKNIIDISHWHEDDKLLFKESTSNSIALQYIYTSVMRLIQLDNKLNYLGYSDDYIPVWTYEYLDLQARNFINIAKQHEGAYLNFLESRDRQHELMRSIEQQLDITKAEKILADQELKYSKIMKFDLERQYGEYGEYPGTDPDKILYRFNELRIKTNDKLDTDLSADILDRISSTVSISVSEAAGVSISPSGPVGIFTSMMRHQAAVEMQNAQFDYEFTQLMLQKHNLEGQIDLANIQITISNTRRKIAQYRENALSEDLIYHENKTLNEEYWWKLAQHARNFVYWYIEKANLIAFYAEQAYEYENDIKLNIIKFNYSRRDFGEIYGADLLLRDLDTIRVSDVVNSKKEILIKHTLSLRESHPFLLEDFRYTGKVEFTTFLQELDFKYPGLYKVQVKNVEINPIGLLPSDGIKGSIENIGNSLIRKKSRDQKREYLDKDSLFHNWPWNYWENGFSHLDWNLKTKVHITTIDIGIPVHQQKKNYFSLYPLDITTNKITLGGNKAGLEQNAKYNYFVIIPGDIDVSISGNDPAKVLKIEKYADGTFNNDTLQIYYDKKVLIQPNIESTNDFILENAWLIQTDSEKHNCQEDALITLSFNRSDNVSDRVPVTIYIAYDACDQNLPQWLAPSEIISKADSVEKMMLSSYDIRRDGILLSADSSKKSFFEGVGYGTTWKLDMPRTENKFDYSTLYDIQIVFYLKAYYDSYIAERLESSKNRLYQQPEYTKRNLILSSKLNFPDAYYALKNPMDMGKLKNNIDTEIVDTGGPIAHMQTTFELVPNSASFQKGDFIRIDNEILRIKTIEDSIVTVDTSTLRPGGINSTVSKPTVIRDTFFNSSPAKHEEGSVVALLSTVTFNVSEKLFPKNEKGINNDILRKLLNISVYFSFNKEFNFSDNYNNVNLRNKPIPIPFIIHKYPDEDAVSIYSRTLNAVRKDELLVEESNSITMTIPRNPKARLFSESSDLLFNLVEPDSRINPCGNYGISFLLPDLLNVEDVKDIIIKFEYLISPAI